MYGCMCNNLRHLVDNIGTSNKLQLKQVTFQFTSSSRMPVCGKGFIPLQCMQLGHTSLSGLFNEVDVYQNTFVFKTDLPFSLEYQTTTVVDPQKSGAKISANVSVFPERRRLLRKKKLLLDWTRNLHSLVRSVHKMCHPCKCVRYGRETRQFGAARLS